MKEVKVAVTHTLDGKEHRFIPEDKIVDWLWNLKSCPFCKNHNLTKSEIFHTSLRIICEECDFEVSSKDLLHMIEIKEEKETIEIDWILEDVIKKLVDQYEEQLKKSLANCLLRIRRIEDILILREKQLFRNSSLK